MDTVKQILLEDFKKANKQRKLYLANKYGFKDEIEYLKYLNSEPRFPSPNIQKIKTITGVSVEK